MKPFILLILLILLGLSGCTSPTGNDGHAAEDRAEEWVEWFDEPCCKTMRFQPPDESTEVEDAGRALATLDITHDEDSVMFNLSAHAAVPAGMQFGIEYEAKGEGPIMFSSGVYWYIGAPNATHHPSLTNVTAVGRSDGVTIDVPMDLLQDAVPEEELVLSMLLRGVDDDDHQYFDLVKSDEPYCFTC